MERTFRNLSGQLQFSHPDEEPLLEALQRLDRSLTSEASLKPMGRLMAYADLKRMLKNNFLVTRTVANNPDMAAQTIRSPLFIVGMPRTGSSFLHNLMACDRQWRAPMYWETLYPCPPTPADAPDPKRVRSAGRDFGLFHLMAPAYRKIYMYGAMKAAECIAVMAMSFESPRFGFTYRVPSYWNWIQEHGVKGGYAFEYRFLQMLQSASPALSWLLKAPAHMMHLRTLLEVFPDARIVFTHRHPSEVIPSIASNTWTLRRVFSHRSSKTEVGAEELDRWLAGWQHTSSLRENRRIQPDRYFDLLYRDLISDPMAAVDTIYRYFGLTLDEDSRQAMHTFLTENRRNRHGKHHYTAEEYGLDNQALSHHFADYIRQFSL